MREVDGSEGLFPGGSGGGQELVLHSLHRLPEEGRGGNMALQPPPTLFPQGVQSTSKEKARASSEVSNI